VKRVSNRMLAAFLMFKLKAYISTARTENPELGEQDFKMFVEAEEFMNKAIEESDAISEIFYQSANTKWNALVTEMIDRAFYAKLLMQFKPTIKRQLNQLEKFMQSDICYREIRLNHHFSREARLLKEILEIDPTYFIINAFYFLVVKLFPNEIETKHYVRVSEVMSYLQLHRVKPYLTLDEAIELADKNKLKPETSSARNQYNKKGTVIIFDRLKQDVDKKFDMLKWLPDS